MTPTLKLNNGVEMPALGLGVFQTPPDETRDAVRAALGAGYRHIDTAAAYGNERQVGEAVHSSDLDRSDVFLETKIWISDYGFMVEHLTTLLDRATVVPAVNQIECHPYFAQRHVQDFGAKHGILTQAWSPIGDITFYRDGSHGSTLDDPVIGDITTAHGKTPAQVDAALASAARPLGHSEVHQAQPHHRAHQRVRLRAVRRRDGRDRRPGHRPPGGPEPETITLEAFGREIPEA